LIWIFLLAALLNCIHDGFDGELDTWRIGRQGWELRMPKNFISRHRGCALLFILILYMSAGQCPIIGLTGPLADAQLPESAFPPKVIRVSTNLVTLPISVTDSEGRAVRALRTDDFLIEEDGRIESVSKVSEAVQLPLQLALLIDLSGSVNPRFNYERQAATQFLKIIWKPGDTISVITFSEHPKICLTASDSLADALQVLRNLQPTVAPTAFFDSAVISTRMMRQTARPEAMQSVIALSDGEDNRSENNLSNVLIEVQNSAAIFYSINPAGSSIRLNEISRKGQADLETIARVTGGAAFISDRSEDLESIFRRIAMDLRAQYLLSYYSTNTRMDGCFRQVSVSIPQRPELHVRARRGYYAAKQ
jgi:VWFA-related protein